MHWRPNTQYVLVEISDPGKTETGLFLVPGSTGEGTVLAVRDRPYHAGDEVLFASSDLIHHNSLPTGEALLHIDHVLAYRTKENP